MHIVLIIIVLIIIVLIPDTRCLIADGAIAQLGERLLCKQEVVGSIPSGSTRRSPAASGNSFAGISIRALSTFVEGRPSAGARVV